MSLLGLFFSIKMEEEDDSDLESSSLVLGIWAVAWVAILSPSLLDQAYKKTGPCINSTHDALINTGAEE